MFSLENLTGHSVPVGGDRTNTLKYATWKMTVFPRAENRYFQNYSNVVLFFKERKLTMVGFATKETYIYKLHNWYLL